jgi:fatty-acyl-CoA synthase
VVDDVGAVLASGRQGRLLVRGPGVQPDGDQGWHDSEERGLLDKQGRLKLLPRTDDLRCVEGLVVSLEEIRQTLQAHPAVRDAAVSLGGGPGNDVALEARVTTHRKISPERLSGYLAARLSLHKIPERIALVDAL